MLINTWNSTHSLRDHLCMGMEHWRKDGVRSPWSRCPGALVSGRGRKRLTGSTENPSAPPQTHTNLRQKGTLRAVLAPATPGSDLSPGAVWDPPAAPRHGCICPTAVSQPSEWLFEEPRGRCKENERHTCVSVLCIYVHLCECVCKSVLNFASDVRLCV